MTIDLLFKKVFSDPDIARSFLEDLLGILITEIVVLGIEHKLSDDAVIVKFDYRCKVNGEYVIIEMQQQYKKDVIKRFYLYHCLDTALQLEMLQSIEMIRPNGEKYKEKVYSGVVPVHTILWMVDDSLNFNDDFIVFTTLPELAKDFISDETLWSQPLEKIVTARAETLKILNNTTKDLGFLQKNRMIYVFQENIVKNRRNRPYNKWFDLAKKSKNPKNVKSDFDEFKDSKVMAEVIRRLEKTKLEPYEYKYVSDLYQYENMLDQTKREAERMAQEVMQTKQEAARSQQEAARSQQEAARSQQEAARSQQEATRMAQEAARSQQEAKRMEQELVRQKERAEQAEKTEKTKILKAVHGFLMLGKDVPYIADILGISIEETYNLAEQISDK
ncbi:MAG: hypothetical protein U5L45_18240 [Saprospiraceae bacterium]|nr:hypothetical protein [Saprospiraceae bacterium]